MWRLLVLFLGTENFSLIEEEEIHLLGDFAHHSIDPQQGVIHLFNHFAIYHLRFILLQESLH